MKFGQRMRERREELGLSRAKLADCLNVSMSAISNYENGVSFPREEILLRVFDCLRTDPNALFRDSFEGGSEMPNAEERTLLENYRILSPEERKEIRNLAASMRFRRNAGRRKFFI